MDPQKRTWAEINLGNIEHNYLSIKASLPDGCRFLGVVKADAYGHGAVRVSRLLEDLGADYLAVSCLDEALELRNSGITIPLLILGPTNPVYTETLMDMDITQTVVSLEEAREYSRRTSGHGGVLKVHIKADTGMGRLGFSLTGGNFDRGVSEIISSCGLPGIFPEGMYTHFAVSDENDPDSREYTEKQFELFTRASEKVRESRNGCPVILHCANSGAVVNYREMSLDMVRPGLLLYGYGDSRGDLDLLPCMTLATTISAVKYIEAGSSVSYGRTFTAGRRTRIGVIPVGYADGLFRCLSGKCSFLSESGPVSQCGRICMDMCMVDITDYPELDQGSRIEIFGTRGSLETLSALAGTIPYELMCSVSKRVPRIYKG